MHPLDHPVWHALITRQAGFGARRCAGAALSARHRAVRGHRGNVCARFAALGALMSPSDYVVLFTPDPVTAPAEFKTLLAKTGEQMIGMPAEASRAPPISSRSAPTTCRR